jgi:hypothetical protein
LTARNDITGDLIKSKTSNDKFQSGWDLIDWSKKDEQKTKVAERTDGEGSNREGNENE